MAEKITIPVWPFTLPLAPLLDAYDETHASLAQSVTSGNKSILLRRNSTRSQSRMSVAFNLNKQQAGYFETFFYSTLAGGTLRFSFEHPRKREQIEVSFDPTVDQAFTLKPQQSMSYFKVAFTLIVWD